MLSRFIIFFLLFLQVPPNNGRLFLGFKFRLSVCENSWQFYYWDPPTQNLWEHPSFISPVSEHWMFDDSRDISQLCQCSMFLQTSTAYPLVSATGLRVISSVNIKPSINSLRKELTRPTVLDKKGLDAFSEIFCKSSW